MANLSPNRLKNPEIARREAEAKKTTAQKFAENRAIQQRNKNPSKIGTAVKIKRDAPGEDAKVVRGSMNIGDDPTKTFPNSTGRQRVSSPYDPVQSGNTTEIVTANRGKMSLSNEDFSKISQQKDFQSGDIAFDGGKYWRVDIPFSMGSDGKFRNAEGFEVRADGAVVSSAANTQLRQDKAREAANQRAQDQTNERLEGIESGSVPFDFGEDKGFQDLFKTDFLSFFAQAQERVAANLAATGLNVNLDDPGLQQALNKFKTEAVQKGFVPNAEDAISNITNIMEGYAKQEAGITSSQEVASLGGVPGGAIITEEDMALQREQSRINLGVKTLEDGSSSISITNDFELPLTGVGSIDWTGEIAPEQITLSAIDLAVTASIDRAIVSTEIDQINAADDALKRQAEIAHEQALKEYEMFNTNFEKVYGNMIDRAEMEKTHADEILNHQKSVLAIQESRSIDDIKESQDKAFNYMKARLHAMGADDSIKGIGAIAEQQVKFAKQITRTRQDYDFAMQELTIQQAHLSESFVQTIKDITVDQTSNMMQNNLQYSQRTTEIENAKLLSSADKQQKLFQVKLDYLNGIKEKQAAAEQERKEALKEMRERNFEAQKLLVTQKGYDFEVNGGEIQIKTDALGNPKLGIEGLYKQMQIQKMQTDIDKDLSEKLGVQVLGGQIMIDPSTGQAIETPKEYTQFFDDGRGNITGVTKKGESVWLGNFGEAKDQSQQIEWKEIQNADGTTSLIPLPKRSGGTSIPRQSYLAGNSPVGLSYLDESVGGAASQFLASAVANKQYVKGGQCGKFVNDYLQKLGDSRVFNVDAFAGKLQNAKDSGGFLDPSQFDQTPVDGAIAIFDMKGTDAERWGHVGVVKQEPDGSWNIIDSNYTAYETVDIRDFDKNDKRVVGYYVPEAIRSQAYQAQSYQRSSELTLGQPFVTYQKAQSENGNQLDFKQKFDAEMKLRTSWSSQQKFFQKGRLGLKVINQGWEEVQRAIQDGESLNFASQAMLVTFQKVLDPDSVVRESEYERSGVGQSLAEEYKAKWQKIMQGGGWSRGRRFTTAKKYGSTDI